MRISKFFFVNRSSIPSGQEFQERAAHPAWAVRGAAVLLFPESNSPG